MQERLARLKELEERKKREEEEKLRKEEEERRLHEELERQAEEKKRLRKEMEKEKLLKKKQEGRLLTGKQKEEARRREVMRNQILANAGGLSFPTGDAGGAPTKRPKYETKKSRQHHSQANSVAPAKSVESTETKESQQEGVAEVDSMELEKVEEVDTMSVEEKTEVADEVEENGIEEEDDDDEDEWDAKSWDDADLKLPGKSAFADEEADSEPEHVVKKEVKSTRWAGGDAGPAVQKVSQEIDIIEKNKRKELSGKMEAPNLDAQPNQGEIDLRSPICCIWVMSILVKPSCLIVSEALMFRKKVCRNAPIVKAMKQQSKDVQLEFNMRLTQVITQFKEQGLNTEFGEGIIPDLLLLLVQWTQKTMVEKVTYSNEVQCTVLEVKVVEGHGTTIDVVLVNGVLHEGDQIVVCGMQGPIVTSIGALLTPHPMKELRVKGTYLHHKEIKAAQGIKITAQGLEHAIAGTSLYVVGLDDDLEDIMESAMEDVKSVLNRIDRSGEGVGTPICIRQKKFIGIGRIASIENNHKPIVSSNPEEQHFEIGDELVSHISRRSIDVLRANYRDDLSLEEWKLVVTLKSLFKMQ
ncbi:hypothetical protein TEA_027694 [Camellia sinensis var. sinensis]|uniref:Uncharacterized protein n=1 Tax=Camellia sinensis var. sinensis TaxID=542762 RepID=A0A4S4ELC2_CAMSN|nr:hypothetical protein TEA_027694 [Camellia sinensis var. sinensis]